MTLPTAEFTALRKLRVSTPEQSGVGRVLQSSQSFMQLFRTRNEYYTNLLRKGGRSC
jgi:hypothetical protein